MFKNGQQERFEVELDAAAGDVVGLSLHRIVCSLLVDDLVRGKFRGPLSCSFSSFLSFFLSLSFSDAHSICQGASAVCKEELVQLATSLSVVTPFTV
jgi:hypothetical protein